jgi:hypothetical protein
MVVDGESEQLNDVKDDHGWQRRRARSGSGPDTWCAQCEITARFRLHLIERQLSKVVLARHPFSPLIDNSPVSRLLQVSSPTLYVSQYKNH